MIHRILHFLLYGPYRGLLCLYYKYNLGAFGFRSLIIKPLRLDGKKRIYIGNNVIVKYKSWLASTSETGYQDSVLVIEDGCNIGNFNHIYATRSIVLHKNVLTADRVYISDNLHGYDDIGTPILQQPILQKNNVEIGEGTWLGENVCVIGAKIGKHCIIGANSVVTRNIPDYSVAVGSPARIIKKYDFNDNSWKKVEYLSDSPDNLVEGGGKFRLLYAA